MNPSVEHPSVFFNARASHTYVTLSRNGEGAREGGSRLRGQKRALENWLRFL